MKHLPIPTDLTKEERERFWANVNKDGPVARPELGSCWVWLGYRRNGQHGSIRFRDRILYAHRISFAVHFGTLPLEKVVCHHCDVPSCVRPDHLFLGTQLDNIADMRAKGRGCDPPVHRGLANANAHLTDAEVAELRSRKAGGETQRALAKAFGVSQSTVWRLAHGLYRGGGG